MSIVACKRSEDLKSNYEILSTKGPETGLSCDQELFITFQIDGMLLTPLPIPRYILHRRYQNCYNLSVSLQFSFNLLEDNFVCKG